jgi:hypothetical protein
MNASVLAAVIQMIGLAIKYGPQLAEEGQTLIALVESGQDPTPEQQAAIDALLAKVDAQLQADLDAKLGPEATAQAGTEAAVGHEQQPVSQTDAGPVNDPPQSGQ